MSYEERSWIRRLSGRERLWRREVCWDFELGNLVAMSDAILAKTMTFWVRENSEMD